MKKITIFTLFILICLNHAHATIKTGPFAELTILKQILAQSEDSLDLARIKLTVDKFIDPSINIEEELRTF